MAETTGTTISSEPRQMKIARDRETIMFNMKEMLKGRMKEKRADKLIEELFAEKLEADTWLNFYKKAEKSRGRALTAQQNFNLAQVTETQI